MKEVEDTIRLLHLMGSIPQFKAFIPLKLLETYEQTMLNWFRLCSTLNANIIEYYLLVGVTSIEASRKVVEYMKGMDEKDKDKIIKLWIDVFEKEFNTLLSSERFTKVVSNITGAYSDMLKSIMDLAEANLKELGLPTRSEMDSVYREMVKMKRDIARLSEEIDMLKGNDRERVEVTNSTNNK